MASAVFRPVFFGDGRHTGPRREFIALAGELAVFKQTRLRTY